LVDVLHGQKTGFFLDQRESRARVRALAAGRRVLNAFAYTGGMGITAALGGAAEVVSVDTSRPALALAEEAWAANGLPAARGRFVVAREDPRMTAAHRALAPRLEREAPHLGALAAADERARAAARLAHQADRAERHLAIDRLAHVVERQARDRDRGERFHLDPGRRRDRDPALD